MIRLRQSGVDEILIKRVQDWYDPGPGVFIQSRTTALFSPEMLFTGSTTGVWYDPSDFTTLFQDAAGTTPVTAVGQPVGRMLDKSGRGNHAFNPTAVGTANFPVLQQDGTGRYYLAFNGTNQWLQTNSIDFTYGDKMFVAAGVRKLSDSTQVVAELSSDINSNSGTFVLPVLGANYAFASRGTVFAGSNYAISGNTYTAPTTNTIGGVGSISGDSSVARINGSQVAISTTDQGTGNYGNYPLYIGARAGSIFWFNGRLYQMVVAGKQASADEITNTETFINQKTGAY